MPPVILQRPHIRTDPTRQPGSRPQWLAARSAKFLRWRCIDRALGSEVVCGVDPGCASKGSTRSPRGPNRRDAEQSTDHNSRDIPRTFNRTPRPHTPGVPRATAWVDIDKRNIDKAVINTTGTSVEFNGIATAAGLLTNRSASAGPTRSSMAGTLSQASPKPMRHDSSSCLVVEPISFALGQAMATATEASFSLNTILRL